MQANRQTDLRTVDKSTLQDIRAVHIDTSLPCPERIQSYIKQIRDPYRYLDDGIVVEIGYANTDISLQDRLKAYATSLG